MPSVGELIKESFRHLLRSDDVLQWLRTERPQMGDVVIVNNSFIHRDTQTSKSEKYLAAAIDSKGLLEPVPMVAHGIAMNSDLKAFDRKDKKLKLDPLEGAIKSEIRALGDLVFLLIAEIQDNQILEESLNHAAYRSVVWNPALNCEVRIAADRIEVRDTRDEEYVWSRIGSLLGAAAPASLRTPLAAALRKLGERAVARVELPTKAAPATGITDSIVKVLNEHRVQYVQALSRCNGVRTADGPAFNELLRIAYNFASDALSYLRLIVSVCDLKSVVLWGTISEHYGLSAAFAKLPWPHAGKKPSLSEYSSTIADARNSAFHKLFPFSKTLDVWLPEAALKEPRLRIFSEYGKKSENAMRYKDKELVDVLTEFTRTRERDVTPAFWKQNEEVMAATVALFDSTSRFLKFLWRAGHNRVGVGEPAA